MNAEASSQSSVPWEVKLVCAVGALLAVTYVLSATRAYGIGLSPDSVEYLAGAEHLMSGEGFTGIDGKPIAVWPPLYPAMLALVASVCRTDPLAAARWLSAMCFGISAAILGTLAWRMTRSRLLAAIAVVLAVVCVPLRIVGVMAWSELPFIALSLLCLWVLSKERTWRAVVLAGMLAAAAYLSRYAGITLVLTGAIWLALPPSKRRLAMAAVFLVLACLPVGLWMQRNRVRTGTSMGERTRSALTLRVSAGQSLYEIGTWFTFGHWQSGPKRTLLIGCIGLCVYWLAWRRQRSHQGFTAAMGGGALPGLCGLFAGLYLAFVVGTSALVAYDPPDQRLLSPAFGPLLLLILYGAWLVLNAGWPLHRTAFLVGAIAGSLTWTGALDAVNSLAYGYRGGIGINSRAWIESETVTALKGSGVTKSAIVFSNHRPGLWFLTRLVPRRWPRLRYSSTSAETVPMEDRYGEMMAALRSGRRVLGVWFGPELSGAKYYATPDIVERECCRVVLIRRCKDGAIYEFLPGSRYR